MFPVGALWGFRDADELTASGARRLIGHPTELLALLETEDPVVRDSVIRTLGIVGGEQSAQALYALFLESPNAAITEALGRLRAPALDVELFAALSQGNLRG